MERDREATFVFWGANEVVRNDDSHYPFRQDSNFFYLTGFDEPGAVLVLSRGESFLFVRDRDPDREVWDGELYGVDRAKSVFGMDQADSVRGFCSRLQDLLKGCKRIYVRPEWQASTERMLEFKKAWQVASLAQGKGSHGLIPLLDPSSLLAQLRVVKDAEEIERMRTVCRVTAQAHQHLLKTVRPGMLEREVMAEFQHFILMNGCDDLGYSPIFASGRNATTLHYVKNNERIRAGDLMLVDAAGEIELYTADLTQTFPVGARFSNEQRQVYEAVLRTNRMITQRVAPGVTYRELHQESCMLLTEELIRLGVLSGDVSTLVQNKAYRPYYMHGLGHFLGLDVHDAGIYDYQGADVKLEPGMILTNEPGLYFRAEKGPYAGIGVRIEDDLLVTENGCENLTRDLVRDVEAIEALRS